MRFRVRRLGSGNWTLVPDSGKYKGVPIIHAEVISMANVKFESRIATGTLRGIWGATVIESGIFDDAQTVKALGFGTGNVLHTSLSETLTLDYDGFIDCNKVKCSTASRLLLVRDSIYAEGAK